MISIITFLSAVLLVSATIPETRPATRPPPTTRPATRRPSSSCPKIPLTLKNVNDIVSGVMVAEFDDAKQILESGGNEFLRVMKHKLRLKGNKKAKFECRALKKGVRALAKKNFIEGVKLLKCSVLTKAAKDKSTGILPMHIAKKKCAGGNLDSDVENFAANFRDSSFQAYSKYIDCIQNILKPEDSDEDQMDVNDQANQQEQALMDSGKDFGEQMKSSLSDLADQLKKDAACIDKKGGKRFARGKGNGYDPLELRKVLKAAATFHKVQSDFIDALKKSD